MNHPVMRYASAVEQGPDEICAHAPDFPGRKLIFESRIRALESKQVAKAA
jgi:hypothetical protein